MRLAAARVAFFTAGLGALSVAGGGDTINDTYEAQETCAEIEARLEEG